MVTDGLTKPLTRVLYERWIAMLGMVDIEHKSKGKFWKKGTVAKALVMRVLRK